MSSKFLDIEADYKELCSFLSREELNQLDVYEEAAASFRRDLGSVNGKRRILLNRARDRRAKTWDHAKE